MNKILTVHEVYEGIITSFTCQNCRLIFIWKYKGILETE